MIIDPTSHAGRMIEAVSGLQFAGWAGIIFILGMLLLVGAMIYFLNGGQKKPPCPRSVCGSTDVERFTEPNDPIRLVHYRCRMCSHEWQNGPSIIIE